MIKDFDGVSRYIDPLVHQSIMTAAHLHINNGTNRSFAFSVGGFIRCIVPRHVTASNTLSMLPSHFTPTSFPSFPDTAPWLSLIFNSLPFILFTTDNMYLSQDTHSSIPFHQP